MSNSKVPLLPVNCNFLRNLVAVTVNDQIHLPLSEICTRYSFPKIDMVFLIRGQQMVNSIS